MIKNLRTKKRYFYKLLKNGKKKKITQKKYQKKKRRKKEKMIGGDNIIEVNENNNETEFEQHDAVINYGSAPISTFNLVNCIAIGGVFELDGHIGTFLTHESPTDYTEQQTKLNQIKKILDDKNAAIIQIIFFRIDEPASTIYPSGLTTTKIISLMLDYCRRLFGLEPMIHYYSCDTSNPLNMRCGKAIISPTQYNSSVIPFRNSREIASPETATRETASSKGTFNVEVLYNKDGEKIYKCPVCNNITGTRAPKEPHSTNFFVHNFNCPNKGKIPVEPTI